MNCAKRALPLSFILRIYPVKISIQAISFALVMEFLDVQGGKEWASERKRERTSERERAAAAMFVVWRSLIKAWLCERDSNRLLQLLAHVELRMQKKQKGSEWSKEGDGYGYGNGNRIGNGEKEEMEKEAVCKVVVQKGVAVE